MENGSKREQALLAFRSLCDCLDTHQWKYTKDEDELTIRCSARGDDLPMELNIGVDEERQVIVLLSPQPFSAPEEKIKDMAIAVSVVNNSLIDGCFCLDVCDGQLFFRMTCSFRDSILGDALFTYLIFRSFQTIDEYNDKFMLLSMGLISLDQFIRIVSK